MCPASYSVGSKPNVHGRIEVSFFIAVMTMQYSTAQQSSGFCVSYMKIHGSVIRIVLWLRYSPFRVLEVTGLIWQILAINKGYPLLEVII